jgi:hypothetical protein
MNDGPPSFVDLGDLPWPIDNDDLLNEGQDWRMVAHLDQWYPWHEGWITYAAGYRQAAQLIIDYIATEHILQELLIWPFVNNWRHCVELQLKSLILLLRDLLREEPPFLNIFSTHSIQKLWSEFRGLAQEIELGPSSADLDKVEKVLLQFEKLDPTSQAFRYPISKDGKPSLPDYLRRLDFRQFHETMERIANFLENGYDDCSENAYAAPNDM